MSKSKSTDTFRHDVKDVNRWDQAIVDARKEINLAESKIKQMRRAIKAFEAMRDTGEPWPGTQSLSGIPDNSSESSTMRSKGISATRE